MLNKELPASSDLQNVNKKDLVCAIYDNLDEPDRNIDLFYNQFWREPRNEYSYALAGVGFVSMKKFYNMYSSPIGKDLSAKLILQTAKYVKTPYWLSYNKNEYDIPAVGNYKQSIVYFDEQLHNEMGLYDVLIYYLNAHGFNQKIF